MKWKKQSNGRTALLVEGARRVGKSTLVSLFGKNEYRPVLLIDFFQAAEQVKGYFNEYRDDLDTLFLYLSVYYHVELFERESLVVFDEVQAFPQVWGLIKYLVADGHYDYIETWSLISIKQNVQDIVIPSEKEAMELNPLGKR